jgi:hypothetical protein
MLVCWTLPRAGGARALAGFAPHAVTFPAAGMAWHRGAACSGPSAARPRARIGTTAVLLSEAWEPTWPEA